MKLAILEIDQRGIKDAPIEIIPEEGTSRSLKEYMEKNGFELMDPHGGIFFKHLDGRVRYANRIFVNETIHYSKSKLNEFNSFMGELEYNSFIIQKGITNK